MRKVHTNPTLNVSLENKPFNQVMLQTPLIYRLEWPWRTYANILADIIECYDKSKEKLTQK